jgi:hypothetical protein
MALVLADRVRETTTTTGTVAVVLAGAYPSFQSFLAAVGNGNTTYYAISNLAAGEWEVGVGTYTSSGNTLSRDTVLSSSNAGSLVNFSAGSKDVICTQPAERAVYLDSATNATIPQITVSAGAVGTPAITTTGDTNTGIYFPAADTIAFTEGGVESMRITSAGNVGIGTASPGAKLDVRTTAGTSAAINLYSGSNATQTKFSIGQIGSVDWDIGVTATNGHFLIGGLGGTVAEAYRINRNGAAIDFQAWNTAGFERMRIDSSGNVAIGSNTAAGNTLRYLDLQNSDTGASAGAIIRFVTSNVAASGVTTVDVVKYKNGSFFINNNETNAAAFTAFGVGASERMRIDASGNVGIGTSSPVITFGKSLNLYNDANTGTVASNTYLLVESVNRNAVIELAGNSTAANFLNFSDVPGTAVAGVGSQVADQNLLFRTGGGTERMRIDSSGNVGIGTSTPAGKLHVNGGSFDSLTVSGNSTNSVGARFQNSAASARNWNIGSSGGGPSPAGTFFIYDDTASATRMVINSSGAVGIGTTSPNGKMEIVGGRSFFAPASEPFAVGVRYVSTGGSFYFGAASGSATPDGVFSQAGGAERMRITDSGTLCVGTTSSLGARFVLHGASGGTDSNIQITNPGYGTACIGLTGTSSNVKFYNCYTSGTLSTGAGIDIDTAGNLLVGTTSTIAKLTVVSPGATAATKGIQINNSSGTELLAIVSDGSFFTGTAASSPYNSTTGSAANAFLTSGGQLQRSTSSLKYKTDVQDATHGLAEVLQLRPVTYKGKNDGDTIFGGLIAEEVHAAGLTEFVQYAEDGSPDALAYGNMVSLLTKAIQEQQALITALTSRITALEST